MNKLVIGGIVFTLALLGIVFGIAGGQDVDMSNDTVNLYSAIAAVVIVAVSVAVVLKYVNQMQNDTAGGEKADHEWDGISEYKNELPTGWAIMFLILIAWFFYYLLVKYPVASYSQIGEYNEEVAEYDKNFAEKFKSVETDPVALKKMGKSVFSVNCAPCHGVTGDGLGATDKRESLKAENLTKRTFSAEYVTNVINNGSTQLGYPGGMPDRNNITVAPNYTPISDAEITLVAKYVANGMSGKGKEIFDGACVMCHNEDGASAPSLKTYKAVFVETLLKSGSKKAEIGFMPEFGHSEAMTPLKIKAVSAYVESLQGAK